MYWLLAGNQSGRRIDKVEGQGVSSSAQSFTHTVERRDRSIYFAALRNGERENFFGAVVTLNPVEQVLNLPHALPVSSAPATVEITLQGVTQLAHRVTVELNGAILGDLTFHGQEQGTGTFPVSHAALRDGQNAVRLIAQNGQADVSLVDSLRITYQHAFSADGDSLTLTASGRERVTIIGFTSKAIRVFDVTEADNIQELLGEVNEAQGGYSIIVVAQEPGERRLLALTDERLRRAAAIQPNHPSRWRDENNAADFLIFTARNFFPAVEPLQMARRAQGLRVELIDIADVYDEFAFGRKSPQAIKDFLAYAEANWKLKPRFVLLAGDASYDARNYLGLGEFDLADEVA